MVENTSDVDMATEDNPNNAATPVNRSTDVDGASASALATGGNDDDNMHNEVPTVVSPLQNRILETARRIEQEQSEQRNEQSNRTTN